MDHIFKYQINNDNYQWLEKQYMENVFGCSCIQKFTGHNSRTTMIQWIKSNYSRLYIY